MKCLLFVEKLYMNTVLGSYLPLIQLLLDSHNLESSTQLYVFLFPFSITH